MARLALLQLIMTIFVESRNTYGSRRVHAELRREGHFINHKVVEKLMSHNRIAPVRRRKFKNTTDSRHKMPVSENVLQRNFEASAPNEAWVSDITYIETTQGWLYLAVFIDLHSRMVVGHSISESMTAQLVVDAFNMGLAKRGGVFPKVVHSDRGSQYASEFFRDVLKKQPGCKQSMSRKGNCWDNAVSESFFKTLKVECLYRNKLMTRKACQLTVFEYIEIFYNRQRLNSVIGYKTPEEIELKGKKVTQSVGA
jgi:putative transposase